MSVWNLNDLIRSAKENNALIDGSYVPARPVQGFWIHRVRAAWEVFRGRAEAFYWPKNQ